MKPLELWGGPECTINRVGARTLDQLERTGFYDRLDDIDRIAALGVTAVRFPLLWERGDPSWADARLERLRAHGIRVIAGLVHHGSGPVGTSLVEESFVPGLAEHARRIAERYPWIEDYTPVNEALTTARFTSLYGHWYPHLRDARSFARAVLMQARATSAAMAAIRRVTPGARLIQTEDMGRIFGTRRLSHQVIFENNRRWLALDLMFGRVVSGHPLHRWLLAHGVPRRWLEELAHAPCRPALIGANYYVTSDRFLDDHLERYPAWTHGGNGRVAYADVEAVRVRSDGIVGHRAVLREVAARYRTPVAITEAHLGCCDPHDPAAWLLEAWTGAAAARADGVEVPAVTLWSAFGAYDWDSLLTQQAGRYEPGAYDVRSGTPVEQPLAGVARALARGEVPLAVQPGWWRRDDRLIYRDVAVAAA